MTGGPGRGQRDGSRGGDGSRDGGSAAGDAGRRPALDDVFRPRAARLVTGTLAVVVALATVLLIVLLSTTGIEGWSTADLSGIALVGLAIVWFLWRQATVAATPTAEGLRVRNLASTRTVAWAEIVWVRFGEGRPWVQLDLDDGDTLAVMGVQRSDGERARREAKRLATLVAARQRTGRDD
ncbi:PH domain-containing protein [Cellulomonas sp. ACRRI]|uniref:PH domain-containing protein n=1 Tax=Cellulomonas sp. ACRRI TaxID=2918188 RepID=UPI001EF1D587|nr:PH domain-containing protein [Cellulomonas sp. ACRRI]MCG7288322.1 PH domain-containing protein [Cellulomonas sp. ACRRI]